MMLQNIGGLIFNSVDRIAVGNVLGLSYVTYYSIGVTVANVLFMIAGSLSHSLMPAVSEIYAKKDYQRIYKLLWKGTGIIAVFSVISGMTLIIISKPFLQLWMGEDFMNQSLSMFRILVLAYTLMSLNAPAYHIANGMGAPFICAISAIIGGIMTIALIFLLGKTLFLDGVALANFGFLASYIIPLYIFRRLKFGKTIPI
jgi:O-antigen/teichoic acid export membrane protein